MQMLGKKKVDDDIHQTGRTSRHPFLFYKVLKQILLTSTFITMGSGLIVGPSIPDLSASLGYTYEEISRGLALQSIGAFAGSLIGGILHDLFPRWSEIIMAAFMVASAVAGIFIPVASPLPVMMTCMFIVGLSFTVLDTGTMPMVLEMWGDDASGPMHALHFGFGFGAILAPLIVRPFLSTPEKSVDNELNNLTTIITETTSINDPNSVTSFYTTTGSSLLMYPFGIVFGTTILMAVLLALVGIYGAPKGYPVPVRRTTLKRLLTPSSCYPGRPGYSSAILVLLFFYFVHAVAAEHVYGTFVFTYVVESGVYFDKPKAAILNSVYWGSFVIGRFSGIFLSNKLQPQHIITACLASSLAIYISLIFFSTSSSYAMWILTILAGYTNSLLFASGILWGKKYIAMNSMAIMICTSGSALGIAAFNYMTGYLFDNVGFQSFGYILTFYAVSYIILFAVMQVYVYKFGRPAPAEMEHKAATYNPVAYERGEDPNGEDSDECNM